MSLSDELEAEASFVPLSQRSQIDLFMETLPEADRADIDAWIASCKSVPALYRVLKRRGLPVADSTFRNWVAKCR
jgi:hypothetical protein